MSAVGNEQQFHTVCRPGGTDLVVKLAVVIARQGAAVLAGESLNISELAVAEISGEDVEMSVIGR
jgi:Na+-translocating ferredoxin:NAD+ oxidoreductase RNF subunit RnfB